MNEKIDIIKNIIEEFFSKMGFVVSINDIQLKDEIYFVYSQANEAKILIGESGDILFKTQSILNKIINKILKEDICIDLDINDYKKERTVYLQNTAQKIGEEVKETGISKTISDLSPYERRVIHVQIAKMPELETQSIGEGEERKLIIKLKN